MLGRFHRVLIWPIIAVSSEKKPHFHSKQHRNKSVTYGPRKTLVLTLVTDFTGCGDLDQCFLLNLFLRNNKENEGRRSLPNFTVAQFFPCINAKDKLFGGKGFFFLNGDIALRLCVDFLSTFGGDRKKRRSWIASRQFLAFFYTTSISLFFPYSPNPGSPPYAPLVSSLLLWMGFIPPPSPCSL